MANTTTPHDPASPPPRTAKSTMQAQQQAAADAYKVADDIAYDKATKGVAIGGDELRDKVLAMGGDATRASPDPFQPLDDAVPGFTTTTGVHKTPMDPTTAAVPASPDSVLVQQMRGTPTVGSGRTTGKGETLYAPPPNGDAKKE